MGDAGQPTPVVQNPPEDAGIDPYHDDPLQRTVNVLVTGFGPFKSFTTNPSFLIASALPQTIDVAAPSSPTADLPRSHSLPNRPVRDPHPTPYRINIHAHPTPVLVSYDTTAIDTPNLIAAGPPQNSKSTTINNPPSSIPKHSNAYDYILHIGMAAGRENYTLEILAHRDGYIIKDVNNRDGFTSGESSWRAQSLPQILEVGWHKTEVLARWERFTAEAEDEFEIQEAAKVNIGERVLGSSAPSAAAATSAGPSSSTSKSATQTREETRVDEIRRGIAAMKLGRRAEVKLSNDAGRFLCEFILYTSLGYRWREARDEKQQQRQKPTDEASPPPQISTSKSESAQERIGKVAFLHVPGGTTAQDTARGARVAVAVIRALVGSWEDGFRNQDVYESHVA